MKKLMVAAIAVFGLGALGLVAEPTAAVAQQAKQGQEMPAKPKAKSTQGQRKGADKCAKLDDPQKRQACIAQEAQAKKDAQAKKAQAKKVPGKSS